GEKRERYVPLAWQTIAGITFDENELNATIYVLSAEGRAVVAGRVSGNQPTKILKGYADAEASRWLRVSVPTARGIRRGNAAAYADIAAIGAIAAADLDTGQDALDVWLRGAEEPIGRVTDKERLERIAFSLRDSLVLP